MNCTVITTQGTPCTFESKYEFEGRFCTRHFNKKCRDDQTYLQRYNAHLEAEEALQQERQQQEAAAAVAAAEQRRIQQQERKTRRNEKYIQDAPTSSLSEIVSNSRALMRMLHFTLTPGLEFPKAYACIAYKSITHVGFPELIRSIVRIVRQGLGHHPIHQTYADVPIAERAAALHQLNAALQPYGEMSHRELLDLLPPSDPYRALIRNRIVQIQQQEQEQQLQHDLVHNPVVFQRDPEGGINLQAFGQDNQNVHRSSVQNATHRAALALLERPLIAGQDTLPEILQDFQHPTYVKWVNERSREMAITEITNDYFTTEAFSLKYGDVLDRVWAYIRGHTNKQDLALRLAQEVCEGIKQCTNGKMARLVNVLRGYDESLETAKPKELFHIRISMLRDRPLEERIGAARALFEEFDIPEPEREAWLTPLVE